MDDLAKWTVEQVISGKTCGCDVIDTFRVTADPLENLIVSQQFARLQKFVKNKSKNIPKIMVVLREKKNFILGGLCL